MVMSEADDEDNRRRTVQFSERDSSTVETLAVVISDGQM